MVQKYEKGTASITLDRFDEIAKALGCGLSVLLEAPPRLAAGRSPSALVR
jgi:hypothetical protein